MEFDLQVRAQKDGGERLFDKLGLAFLDHQDSFFTSRKAQHLAVHQRVGDIEAIERDFGVAVDIRKAEALQRADDAFVHAALTDDA